MAKLTIKQRKFIDEYIICGNATEAAIKAGYSQKTAGMAGSENLKKPYIKS
ncbi:terminase small subunit, partial [Streptococcus suis]